MDFDPTILPVDDDTSESEQGALTKAPENQPADRDLDVRVTIPVDELKRLTAELAAAEQAYQQVQADAADASWYSWLGYAFYTPTGKASTAEHIGFNNARNILLTSLGSFVFAVAYMLPGITATQVYYQDLATNATTTQTDYANFKYYWSNVAAFGCVALGSLFLGLKAVANSYQSMRERIEETSKAERERAAEKLAEHTSTVAMAAEQRKQRDEIRELLRLAKLTAEQQAGVLQAKETTIRQLTNDVKTAGRESDARRQHADDLQRKVDDLTHKLASADALSKQLEVQCQFLQTQLKEGEVRQKIQASLMQRLDRVEQTLELAQSQVKGLENSVIMTNEALGPGSEKKK